jgi:hypothetical protein
MSFHSKQLDTGLIYGRPIMISRAWTTAQWFLLKKVTVVDASSEGANAQKCQRDVRPVNFANGRETSDGAMMMFGFLISGSLPARLLEKTGKGLQMGFFRT